LLHYDPPPSWRRPASIAGDSPSLLRLAVSTRLALAGFVIALIWAAVLWATR